MSEPEADEATAPDRLYGVVGAEQLHSDPFHVWEMNVSEAGEPLVVEEWIGDPLHHGTGDLIATHIVSEVDGKLTITRRGES